MTIVIRPGTREDLFGAFVVFQLALHGFYQSVGEASPEEQPTPEELTQAFAYFRMFKTASRRQPNISGWQKRRER
jgi:hypothetical protein